MSKEEIYEQIDNLKKEEWQRQNRYIKHECPVDPLILDERVSNGNGKGVYFFTDNEIASFDISLLDINSSPLFLVLTERQLQCLYLYFWEGLNEDQIATIAGLHQTTVNQHIKYAIKKLKAAVEEIMLRGKSK